MKEHVLTEKLEQMTRQRNVSVGVLALSLVALVLVSMVAASKRDNIILVPTTMGEFHVTQGRVPDDYVLAVTRDAASLLLNRHPHDTSYFRDNLLRLVEPKFHESMQVIIEKDDQENRFKAGRRNWQPIEICRLPGDGFVTEVIGDLETYVNGKRVENEKIVKRFTWKLIGTRLYLSDILDVEHGQHQCAKLERN